MVVVELPNTDPKTFVMVLDTVTPSSLTTPVLNVETHFVPEAGLAAVQAEVPESP